MRLLQKLATVTTVLAIFLNVYIYTYPSLDSQKCYWKYEYRNLDDLNSIQRAIVSIPYIGDLYKQHFIPEDENILKGILDGPRDIRMMAVGDPQINGNWPSTPYIKRLDNFGNDYYLRHIYHVMKQRLHPDYVAMMGDLLSSQWLGDSEFFNRTRRLVQRSFVQPREQCLTQLEIIEKHENIDWMEFLHEFQTALGEDYFRTPEPYHHENVLDWTNGTFIDPETGKNTEPLFLNVTGNHDIGYGDTTFQHMARWKKLYGDVNYWIEYDNDTDHPWRIVMLNSLALDGPCLEQDFYDYTWQFVKTLKRRPYNGSTILLTHVPMYKREGLCHDGPNFEYYAASGCHGCHPDRVGLLKSQNHLSESTSQKVMDAVFGTSKSGIILTGHDHYGCDNFYNYNNSTEEWVASKEIESEKWVREITVRSIMGDYQGAMGIMTGHFDKENKVWEFDYSECRFVVQHVWWAAQITLLLAVLFNTLSFFC